ncbi:MAG: helix-turn-helix transcriptional regulator [Eubacteriales bacterium]|nr:helix-turn-helix transcriptional regulator [Christensenellaceae bacterium]MEA5064871.1 helix-turn-helix transcriptional regulator [Eubacteriales bacterium]
MNIEIANRLAALRKQSGLSQEQLADRLGISRQAISKWERAESSPDTDNLIALAKLYQVSLDELLKMDPEAEDDALFARLARQADNAPAAEQGASAPDAQASRRLRISLRRRPRGKGRAAAPDAKAARNKAGAPDGPVWRFQGADGRVNLKLFPYPIIVFSVYMLIGFLFDLWHPGWMLYLTIPVYYTALSPDGGFDLDRIPYPLLVAILYLVVGFAWDFWHPGWMLFFTIPLYYTAAGRLIRAKANQAIIAVMLLGAFYLMGASFGHWFQLWLVGPALALIVLATMRERAR